MTVLLAIAGIFVSSFAGFLIVSLALPGQKNRHLPILIRIYLGVAIGNSLYSILAFAWQVIFGRYYNVSIILEIVVLGTLFVLWIRPNKLSPAFPVVSSQPSGSIFSSLLGLAFLLASLVGAITFVSGAFFFPHGTSDAWTIWNLGARFLFLGADAWENAFSPLLLHSDYPLFWAVNVARVWRYLKGAYQVVPILYSFVFLVSVTGLVVSSVRFFCGAQKGWVSGLTLFCSNALFILAPTQCADIPTALFMLSTVVLLYYHDKDQTPNPLILVLAGFTAASCTWVKNEGWLFFLVLTLIRFGAMNMLQKCFSWKEFAAWALGALPVLATVMYFKLVFAPQNDLMGNQGFETWLRLVDPVRYKLILLSFAEQLVRLDPKYSTPVLLILVITLLYGLRPIADEKRFVVQSGLILGLMFLGYFLIYVTTPRDLEWHLTTSMNRLFLQLWPMLVFIFGIMLRSPGGDKA